jgi:DinB superfamily
MAASFWFDRPDASEYAAYYQTYVSLVPDGDILAILETQVGETLRLLARVGEARGDHRYAPGKWSVKEVVAHVIDTERVFDYRALRFARGDETPLAGFEQNDWVRDGRFAHRALAELAAEFRAVRVASIAFYRGLDLASARRSGTANNVRFTVRAIPFIVAGHEAHHGRILRERYLSPA